MPTRISTGSKIGSNLYIVDSILFSPQMERINEKQILYTVDTTLFSPQMEGKENAPNVDMN